MTKDISRRIKLFCEEVDAVLNTSDNEGSKDEDKTNAEDQAQDEMKESRKVLYSTPMQVQVRKEEEEIDGDDVEDDEFINDRNEPEGGEEVDEKWDKEDQDEDDGGDNNLQQNMSVRSSCKTQSKRKRGHSQVSSPLLGMHLKFFHFVARKLSKWCASQLFEYRPFFTNK